MHQQVRRRLWRLLVGFIAMAPVAASPLGRDADGRPLVLLDGQPLALAPGVVFSDSAAFTTAFARAGLDTIVLFANLGTYHSRRGYVAPLQHMREFWRGYRDYDFSQIEALLAPPVQANPRVKIIIWLGIDAYPEFGQRHPDSIIRNDRGDRLIATTHFIRFDPNPPAPGKPEHEAVSFFSGDYRAEAADALTAFVQGVQASAYAGHVISYLIGGGQDAQQYSWSPPDHLLQGNPQNWGDYSPAARQAFAVWLEQRYGHDLAALNAAWRSQLASFEETPPPPARDLCGERPFHDPQTEGRAYDFKRFLAEGRAEFVIHLAQTLRRVAGEDALLGACGGDGGHRRDNTATSLLLRSPALDFLVHQATYGTRLPPSTGGLNAVLDSYAVNGKLFLTDMDHRLFTAPKPAATAIGVVGFNADTVGWAADLEMQRAMWRREYARLWVSGNNAAWFSNFAPAEAYDHPGLREEMRFLHERSAAVVARHATRAQGAPATEVAFICDESAVDYAREALTEFHMAGMANQWREAHLSGVPCRFYYAQDLREGKVPFAKLVVLQNLLDVDVALAERIGALRAAGATVVVLQGTGLVQLARGEGDRLKSVLGLTIRRATEGETVSPVPLRTTQALLQADQWLPAVDAISTESLKEPAGATLTVTDPDAAVLANYSQSKLPAIVASRQVVFVGAYTLSRDLLSRLARLAGAWRVAPPGTVVAADESLLMLHAMRSGQVEVLLRHAAALTELPPGDLSSPVGLRHRLRLTAGRTYLFEQRR